ncbi:transcription factor HES-2 [Halictus rubicundus]|uniref:transcription factor HES-2 n=1 Tax=Halictus rubicundus TaxID=77578 RepID=UPI004035A91B
MMSFNYPHPVSRTYQYKKITKPLLERKRRARINKCLDELKNLMIDALETEGEDISKLEKADILELTVRHLQKLQSLQGLQTFGLNSVAKNDEISDESRWLSGFGHCAAEAYRFLSTLSGEGAEKLARYLTAGLQKTRATNSSLKTSPVPPLPGTSIESGIIQDTNVTSSEKSTTITCKANQSVPSATCNTITNVNNDKEQTSDCISDVKDLRYQRTLEKVKVEVKDEDEEEIDVEHVDKQDPMWRPW